MRKKYKIIYIGFGMYLLKDLMIAIIGYLEIFYSSLAIK